MKIRYASQIRESDCGPIALLNLLKWLGMRVTLRDHHSHLCWLCKLIEGFGSSDIDLSRALSHLKKDNFRFKYNRKPDYKELCDHLTSGGSAILVYPNESGLHACFLPAQIKKSKRILVVNAFIGKTEAFISKKRFYSWVRSKESSVWLISKLD
jgi:hypothetical protein